MKKLLRGITKIPGPRESALEDLLISRRNHEEAVRDFWQDFRGPLTPAGKKAHARIVGAAEQKVRKAEKRVVRNSRKIIPAKARPPQANS